MRPCSQQSGITQDRCFLCVVLRSASSSGKMSVLVHDTEAELQVGSRPGGLSMSLSRLEGPQAAEELRNLMFRMADSLTQLNYSTAVSYTSGFHKLYSLGFELLLKQLCVTFIFVR